MNKTKRTYNSAGRLRSAEQRRDSILYVARELFRSDGYWQTTVEEIARRANVAVPTVYSAYGSKQGILKALFNNAVDWYRKSVAYSTPPELRKPTRVAQEQLRQEVFRACHYLAHTAELAFFIRAVASSDKDLLIWWKLAEKRRREPLRELIEKWQSEGKTRYYFGDEQLLDVFAAMTSVEFYRLLVIEGNWRPQVFEIWLSETLEKILLRDDSM